MSEGAERRSWRGRPSIFIGRAVATVFTVFFFALALNEGLNEGMAEIVSLFIFLAFVGAAVAVAWWNAAPGVLTLIGAGLALAAFAIFTADRNQLAVALLLGGPYVLSGALVWFGATRLARG